jgi:hypothetical protein
MFGIDADGLNHRVKVTPRIPAGWNQAEVRRLRVGESVVDVSYKREGASMRISLRQVEGVPVRLEGAPGDGATLRVPLPAVEVSVGHGLPLRGARTAQMKVLREKIEGRSLRLELEGVAGTQTLLQARRNDDALTMKVEGAELVGDELRVSFGPGTGYVSQVVTLSW